jgi:hypothetical protein
MAAKNDVTGDRIASKANSQAYRDSYEAIFGKKKAKTESLHGEYSVKTDENGMVRISAGKMEERHSDDDQKR